MRSTSHVAVSCAVVSLALLVTSATSVAARKPISGKLSKRGYTVIALAANGRATSVRAPTGAFRLRAPADAVTLHLRAPNATYAGPVVIGRKGTRAILGVRPGAKLGFIRVLRGYAKVANRLPQRFVDAGRWARARHGVPIGAGNFGFVHSKTLRGAVASDADIDGIPDPLDIDDNGNLILDNFEHGHTARSAQVVGSAGQCVAPCAPDVGLASILTLGIDQTVNANAAALTVQDINRALSSFGFLRIGYPHDATTELDCGQPQSRTDPTLGGLSYCTRGGTGKLGFTGPTATVAAGAPFPDCCDPDGNGSGTLNLAPFDPGSEGHPGQFFLAHRADSGHIGTGDVLIERATSGGAQSQFPITLQDVFATVPALVSVDDGIATTSVSYPVAPFTPGCPPPACPPGGPGTFGNGLPVSARPNGDVVLTLTYWRPQRTPIGTETGTWTDIGGLTYSVPRLVDPELPGPQQLPGAAHCQGDLKDTAPDRPASPANTITYTLNITQCLATTGLVWNPGHELQLFFDAGNGSDNVEQTVIFKRQ